MPEKKKGGEPSPAPPDIAPFWSGTISFGLVSIPVNLLAANRSKRESLRMVTESGTPLKRRYFSTRDDRPLEWDEIVRGYEVEKGSFVVVDDEELERLEPERTRDIDLRLFVDSQEIDPLYFERSYFLTPAGNSTKAYRLMARVMEESGHAGIATFVMRAKEYLVAILAENGILRAETLRFADELRSPEDVGLPDPAQPERAEVKRIERAVRSLTRKALDPDELVDRSTERLLALARGKARKGKAVAAPERREEEDHSDVIDLMQALQRSLGGAGGEAGNGDGKSRAGRADAGAGQGGIREAGRRANGQTERNGEDQPLESLSRDELYARARDLDIEGRSSMKKAELVKALERTG